MTQQHIIDSPESIQSQIIQEKLKYYEAMKKDERVEVKKQIRIRIKQLEAILRDLLTRE
jgi:DNA replicative helicase MCM subunit Mcm2 (Cdc46/Mcm family)